MKKLLTVILHDADFGDAPEQTEILSYNGETPLSEALRRAKGKYAVISEGDLECDFSEEFFALLDGGNADILSFDGGYCIKTPLFKSAQGAGNKFCAEVFAALSAKSAAKSELKPLVFASETRADGKEIAEAFDEFNKVKAKLPKEVYSFVFDLICGAAIGYYARTLIDVHDGKASADELAEFDGKLKENTVFYHSLEKRFTYLSLQKLRNKSFRLGFFEYLKLKNKLKK